MIGFAKLAAIAIWVAGIVLASGFWSTFFAVLIPIWGWYLVIEALLVHYGVL